jgi:hypothetical protein
MTCMAVNNVTRELLSTVTDEATLLSVTAEGSHAPSGMPVWPSKIIIGKY